MFKKLVDILRALKLRTKILLGLLVVLVSGGLPFAYKMYFSKLPPPLLPSREVVYLNQDVLTEAERQRFYHLSQGSQLMPYDWFVALEQGDTEEPFSADDSMTRFRLIPDSNTVGNPDHLPVGFAKDDPDPVNGVVNVGLTCAGCHTAQMTYKGTAIRIDGAPGMVDFDSFLESMVGSLVVTGASFTLIPGSKFNRFARRVLKENYSIGKALKLKADVAKYLFEKKREKDEERESDKTRGETATRGGFGRIDALGSGGNRVYRKLDVRNLRTLNAPVKAVPLWYTHEYNWVQSNGSIRQPMARNIIQALAASASLVLPGDASRNDRYISSVRLNNMFEIETTLRKFKAPVWPEKILGQLDADKVKRGEVIYEKRCAFCHAPQRESQPEPDDAVAVKNNKTFFVLRMLPLDKIRTDPMDASNFAERTVDASSMQMGERVPGNEVISNVLSGILQRQYETLKLPPDKQEEWNGYRANILRSCKGYPARPLAGVWATAPYLHNGSVPNLYQLLLPEDQRDKRFFTGNVEFDPVNVGYVTGEFPGGFLFDTSIKGNSNAGHQYGTSLSPEERMDLIEYLKDLKFPETDYKLVAPTAGCP
ncbi:MAG: hypothetical protein QOH51_3114 [Acidobacteriota bacterium]|nr:hypothetical protein [Acidobacteriota bacterium]